MKAFTDIEQSTQLQKILPIESADMCYRLVAYNPSNSHEYAPYCFIGTQSSDIPCWSLAALLKVIPKTFCDLNGTRNVLRMDYSDKDFGIWYDKMSFGVDSELPDITMKSPVNACVKMILELKKMSLL